MNILQAAAMHGIGRVIISGSAQVYGCVVKLPVDESTPIVPLTVYGRHKATEEECAFNFGQAHGIQVTIPRIFNAIGPGMNEQLFLPLVLKQLKKQPECVSLRHPYSRRDYMDVRDLAAAYRLLAESDHLEYTAYNIGSGMETTNAQLIGALAKAIGCPMPVLIQTQTEAEAQTATQADITRIKQELGWNPNLDLAATARWIVQKTDVGA